MKHLLLAVLLAFALAACGQNSTNGTISAQNTTCTSVNSNDSSCVVLALTNNAGAASFTVVSNAGGNTLQFEASGDNGTTWVAINGTPPNSSVGASSTTSTGTWRFAVSGLTNIRVRCSTFVSGTSYVVIQSSPAAASLGGGVGISASGAANDVTCFSAPGVVGPCDTGLATYSASTLSAPKLAISGTANVTGLATLAGGAVIGPGYADDGTPTVAFAAKLSGANLIKAVTGDQYAHNIVLTTLRAAGNFSYTAVPGQQYACRSQGTTTAGHWFGVSGSTAAAWVDLGAVGTSLGALSQPAYGVIIVGAADGANATCLWTGELTPIQTLLGAFTRAGDVLYCSAVTSTHCTALSVLAGNNSGTSYLTENSSGVPAWSGATSGNVIHTVATAAFIVATTGNYFSSIENNASNNIVGNVMPVSGTAKNLFCSNQSALGFVVNITVNQNGTDTALTCPVAATGTAGCSDITHSFAITAGDIISFHGAAVGTNANSVRWRCGFEISGVN